MPQLKQVIVLRSDLEMSEGKRIAQACHASLKSYEKASSNDQKDWKSGGSKKIAVETSESDMRERLEQAKDLQIPAALIKDTGLTEISPGSLTALGVGPAEGEKIDKVTGDLKLVK
jgi:PTH2 family peptidyl-tRNA hydrolase